MRRIGLILTFLALISCSSFRRKQEGEVASFVDVSSSVKAALDTTFFISGNWPDPKWWKEYGDEQLDYIVDVALKESPTIGSAYRKVQSATSQARGVASSLYPKLSAHFQELYAHLSDESLFRVPPSTLQAVINQVDLGLIVNYEFDFWGKNVAKYRAALGEAYAKKAEAALTQISIAVSVVNTYIRFQYLLDRETMVQEAYDAACEIYDLRQLRKANGLDDQFNIDAADEELLSLKEMLVHIDASVAIAVMQLKVLMGRSPDDELVLKKPALRNVAHFPVPNKISIDLLARRADLMAALWNVTAKGHLISAAKAAYFPSVNLAAYGGVEALSWGKLFQAQSLTGFLFPSINLPMFTGFNLEANLDKAHEDYSVAVYQYNERVLQAAKDVTTGLRTLRADLERRNIQIEHVGKKRSQYQLEDLRYETGVAKKLDVLQRKIALLEDSLSLLDIEEAYFHSMIDVVKALGGGYGRE